MQIDHKRQLAAFVAVLLVAAGVVATGARSDAARSVVRAATAYVVAGGVRLVPDPVVEAVAGPATSETPRVVGRVDPLHAADRPRPPARPATRPAASRRAEARPPGRLGDRGHAAGGHRRPDGPGHSADRGGHRDRDGERGHGRGHGQRAGQGPRAGHEHRAGHGRGHGRGHGEGHGEGHGKGKGRAKGHGGRS
ncbi:hypothetical protein QWY28_07050 [Nocardioides sp. SOB77]|uniref:Uncharacterized protein n=1 Tax=Nocardioides oceani TaxID=3058369 RepID=A0ABT8FDQ8_9ACTN|nr:hypothetical protein [Nocardioides oceani]MDN4172690.1 hypothetical protein [Nocardioides oceani]